MWFVLIGVVLLALKIFDVAPVADWSWWALCIPFALAAAWWTFADATGLTQRNAMRQMEEKKAQRRARSMDALGQIDPKARKRGK
nr:TIGR04438 family Trp-rich protein [uncultured Roseateles sp.]